MGLNNIPTILMLSSVEGNIRYILCGERNFSYLKLFIITHNYTFFTFKIRFKSRFIANARNIFYFRTQNFIVNGVKMNAECPVCGASIEFAKGTVVGELLECPECGTELEVIALDPPTVKEAPQEEEDWGE